MSVDTAFDDEDSRLTRLLRSSSSLPSSRCCHLLPNCCILCGKSKTVRVRHSGKRRCEKLVLCETLTAGRLVEAAQKRKDERLLVHIQGQDLVALEARYHHSCYLSYTRFLSKAVQEQPTSGSDAFEFGYPHFCETVIEDRLIAKREILRLTEMNTLFKNAVLQKDGIDVSSYKTYSLKRKLQASYPFLKFLRMSQRCKSQLVFVDDLSADEVLSLNSYAATPLLSSSTNTDTEDIGESDTGNEGSIPAGSLETSEDTCVHRGLYHAAQLVRESIEVLTDTVPNLPWPPTSSNLTVSDASNHVPNELFNFIAWATGCSKDLTEQNSRVHVSEHVHRKILSMCQDIVNLAVNGRRILPKHCALAMSVRNMTGSAQLITLLNGLGHCVSHSQVLEHDTALAQLQLQRGKNFIPPAMKPNVHSILVWDNNDFGEETLSGKGTTHNTNGIIIQRNSSSSITTDQILISAPDLVRSRKRSLEAPPANIDVYHGGQRSGPSCFMERVAVDVEHHLNVPERERGTCIDAAYFLTKIACLKDSLLPSWTGFNVLLQGINVPQISHIGYLPVIDASPTEMGTVKRIIDRSVSIADALGLASIAVVVDQAIYAKVQEIRWKDESVTERLVVRMGEFHTCMAYLGCIGKRFGDAGLQDILIESAVCASGSCQGVLTGHQYNRSLRCNKLVCDALQRLRWQSYLETLSEERRNAAYQLSVSMQAAFPGEEFHVLMNSKEFRELICNYERFIADHAAVETFGFWSNYITMVETLLLFIRATREGSWNLHLSVVRSMLPWFFCYDRLNYARYLTAYWFEMCDLRHTHPQIEREFQAGNFVAQRQQHHPFSQTACDQVIEQTANRDSKTKGGLTGFSLNKGAVHRWTLSQHERAAITRACEEMSGHKFSSIQHCELQNSRMQRDENDVQNIADTLQNMVNPFDPQLDSDKLYHLTSGRVASTPVLNDLRDAESKGEQALAQFCQTRLQRTDVGFHDPMKKLKLKTFRDTAKVTVSKIKDREISLKADRNLFARLIVAGTVRNVDIEEMLVHTLGPLPAALAYHDGSLMKTNKAKLMQYLESAVSPTPTVDIPSGSTWVWDAMALIQSMKCQPTFGQFADAVLRVLLKVARSSGSKEIHFVPDRYRDNSIKDAERYRRGAENSQQVKIYSAEQKTPTQWSKFLSCGENKENLLQFLFDRWCMVDSTVIGDVVLTVGHGDECHTIRTNELKTSVQVQPAPELFCTHEEADTRILLHSAYAARTAEHVLINCPDTDVFVLALAFCTDIDAELYFHTGKDRKVRTLSVNQIHNHFGKQFCDALIGCHCVTGCDSVSALHGIGKQTALTVLKSSREHQTSLSKLGTGFVVPEALYQDVEAYTCELYGQKDCRDVNLCRVRMFKCGKHDDRSLPPTKDSLYKHVQRANYQAAIYKRCLLQKPDIPVPEGNGWKIEDGSLTVDWMCLPPAPSSIMELVHCCCQKTKCTQGRCTCLSNKLPCTDLCSCKDCQNCQTHCESVDDYAQFDSADSDNET